MEGGSGLVLHMLPERVIHKDSLLSKAKLQSVRQQTRSHASQRGKGRHIEDGTSAVIPRGLELSLDVFPGNSSLFQAFVFSVKERGQL